MAKVPSTLPRNLITDHVLLELKTHTFLNGNQFPVGDMAKPDEPHGWKTDEPDQPASNFTPFLSLTPGTARRIEGTIGDSSTEYECPYAVVFCGVSRKQTEQIADDLRKHLHGRDRQSLTYHPDPEDLAVFERWRITQYRCSSIGGLQRVRGSFPDYYTQQDEFIVRVSKEN